MAEGIAWMHRRHSIVQIVVDIVVNSVGTWAWIILWNVDESTTDLLPCGVLLTLWVPIILLDTAL